nr:immunoglobulin light chain junction region [Macaca mulatta]MOY12264.1 immunoglobulin light chain junction region [Macaca mulatta]
CQQYRDLLTF